MNRLAAPTPSRGRLAAAGLCAFAALAAGVALLVGDGAPAAPSAPAEPGTADRAPVSAAPASLARAPDRAGVEIGDAGAPEGRRRLDRPRATGALPLVTGRCIDEHGEPLAGCEVAPQPLRGGGAALPPPVFSGADGGFTLRLPANTPCELRIRAQGRATIVGPSGNRAVDSLTDVGDLILRRGVLVSGVVEDGEGAPQDGVVATLRHDPTGVFRSRFHPVRWLEATSDSAGRVEFADPILPGSWHRSPADRRAGGAKPTVVPEGKPAIALTFVVIRTPAPVHRITGSVVDERGQPVAGALVLAKAAGRGNERAKTGADGRFTLESRSQREPADVRLTVRATGCEEFHDEVERSWGSSGVELQVVRGGALEVRVVDGRRRPVEEFSVYVVRRAGKAPHEARARSHGFHLDGIALAHGVTAGAHAVLVEPHDRGLVQDGVLQLDATGWAQRCEVVLGRATSRRLTVIGASGQPVHGALVELLVPLHGVPIVAGTAAVTTGSLVQARATSALLRDAATTDGRGGAALRGHPHTPYAVRVTTSDHATAVATAVLDRVPDPWVVRLAAGARVRVRLAIPASAPAAVADWLRRTAKCSLVRVATAPGAAEERIAGPTQHDGDGWFRFDRVPAGTWRAELRYSRGRHELFGQTSADNAIELATLPGLRDGETRLVEVSLQRLGLGVLHGTLRLGERPLHADVKVWPEDGEPGEDDGLAVALMGGAFAVILPAGTWRCSTTIYRDITVPLRTGLHIGAGDWIDISETLRSGSAHLRVVDHLGAPAAGVRLTLTAKDRANTLREVTTDERGLAVCRLLCGRYAVTAALPRDGADEPESVELGELFVMENGERGIPVYRLPAGPR